MTSEVTTKSSKRILQKLTIPRCHTEDGLEVRLRKRLPEKDMECSSIVMIHRRALLLGAVLSSSISKRFEFYF